MTAHWECLDGNEAAARIAYAMSEVISIYPITPASGMAEYCDDWSAARKPNLWGAVPTVIEMQSEAGAAGAVHGSLQKGALTTTFTASQGLLLMIPNMFKIAGELTPAVIHVAARTLATHALSIFGDHSDVMHARATGWALLSAGSVQEAHDFALVAHAATLRARVPFLHFFDGFRTSHEVNKISVLDADDLRALIREDDLLAFRRRGLTSEAPVVRGTAQNPDVFFQAREACNPYHAAVPGIVQEVFDELAARTGRQYSLVEYHGAPDADRVVVIMGSGAGAVRETVDTMVAAGEKVGVVTIRLFQPFPADELMAALPKTVRSIAVLDRTKEPGAVGEPMYQAVVAALAEAMDADEPPFETAPRVIGGRYGLSSKEFTPAMIKPVYDELLAARPKRHFTVGIYDDVTRLSLPISTTFRQPRPAGEVQALFFGLGSDGTVGANKASVKIIGEGTDLFAQGYFVYDSKKSGSVTASHLRFGPEPIQSSYLVDNADFVACHQFGLLQSVRMLDRAKHGATFLLNSPYGPDEVWEHLPSEVRHQLVDKQINLWIIDAMAVAAETGMGNRINTIMQPCFFHLSGVLPAADAIERIKAFVKKTYAKRGDAMVQRNFAAIDRSIERLHRVPLGPIGDALPMRALVPDSVPDFIREVTARLMAGDGDLLPVSALPVDGTFPSGTTKYEKRAIAPQIPVWDEAICIDCGKCAIVCPHASIRMKVYPEDATPARAGFPSKEFKSRDLVDHRITIQVSPDDCTGCGVCVDVCPAKSKTDVGHKAINMAPYLEHRDEERVRWDEFAAIAPLDRAAIPHDTVKGAARLEPLFEFSGACAGCGETPYLRLVTQLFGDRMIVANATGCSSIYGANLPTTPWATNAEGRGPAWANSLFEDNAEFGLGMRLALDAQTSFAQQLLTRLAPVIGEDLVREILDAPQATEPEIVAQRERVDRLRAVLETVTGDGAADARQLMTLTDRPRPPGRVDHRRRRLGVRHRLRRAGPGPLVGPQRQHPRARHRGLLQHRRPGLQGHPARCRREVRRRRQGDGQEGPRRDRPLLRQRLRRPDQPRRQRRPVDQGAARGRGLGRPVARHRVCHLHRARHRHVDLDEPPEGRREERLLAALPVPAERGRGRHAVQAGLGQAEPPDRRLRGRRDPVRDPPADRPRPRRHPRRAGPGRRGRALALLLAARGHPAQRPARRPCRAGRRRRTGRGGPRRPRTCGTRCRRDQREGRPRVTVDLRTRYLGLDLRSPLVCSSSPYTGELATARRMERAGAAAIVLPSLFEEEILNEELQLTRALEAGTNQFAEALDYFPSIDSIPSPSDRYVELIALYKRELDIPVIASLNAATPGGWVRYARQIQEAGADALELNLYHLVADPRMTAADRERMDLDLVRAVCSVVTIPVTVKLSPFYSALAGFAIDAVSTGADGLVLFNRFYQPGPGPRDARRREQGRAVASVRAPGPAPLDRDPATAARAGDLARGDLGRALGHGRGQGAARRGGRRDDDLGAPPTRAGVRGDRRARARRVARHARLRVRGPAPRRRDEGDGRRPDGVRACELHGDAPLLVVAAGARDHVGRAGSPVRRRPGSPRGTGRTGRASRRSARGAGSGRRRCPGTA